MSERQPTSIPSEEPRRSRQIVSHLFWCSPSRSEPTALEEKKWSAASKYSHTYIIYINKRLSVSFSTELTRLWLIQPSGHTRGHPVSGVWRQRHRDVDRIWNMDHAAVFIKKLNADHCQCRQVHPPSFCTCIGGKAQIQTAKNEQNNNPDLHFATRQVGTIKFVVYEWL